MSRILIVEDEAGLASALARAMQRRGHEVSTAASATLGLRSLHESRPDLVILDIGLPDRSGLVALEEIQAHDASIPVLVITAHGNLENAVQARKRRAAAYLVKPLDLDEFERTVASLLQGVAAPVRPADAPRRDALLLIGSSAAMQPAFAAIAHACASDAPVLICGPTGIGKSLTAQVIHLHGARHRGPFVTLSCASLPEQLLEAELFGHEKGAFTGAHASRAGHVDRAVGGTLFLDEVGELPPALQVKLLRVVEEKVFTRVGGREDLQADIRIIAATNRDLAQDVADRRFREDLYYRLRVLEVSLPPLAARRSDIPALCSYLLAGISGGRSLGIAEETIERLKQCDWPGNVRELRNVLERAAAVCAGSTLLPTHLPPELQSAAGSAPTDAAPLLDAALRDWLDVRLQHCKDYDALLGELEGRLLRLLMPRFDHRPTYLARELNLHRATLRKRLRALGLTGGDEAEDG